MRRSNTVVTCPRTWWACPLPPPPPPPPPPRTRSTALETSKSARWKRPHLMSLRPPLRTSRTRQTTSHHLLLQLRMRRHVLLAWLLVVMRAFPDEYLVCVTLLLTHVAQVPSDVVKVLFSFFLFSLCFLLNSAILVQHRLLAVVFEGWSRALGLLAVASDL